MHKTMERLYEAAKALKGIQGQSDVGRALNMSPQVIKNWEARGVSKQGRLAAQQLIGCNAIWLETGEGRMVSISNVEPAPETKGKVPLISWVKAGMFCEAIDLLQPGEAEDWITTTVQPRAYTYALRIRGDSMEPTFPDGAVIVVEPEMEPKHGSYVIAKNGNNEATFKQLVQDGGVFYLKPLNPRYPLLPVDANTCFCGVVREMVMRFA